MSDPCVMLVAAEPSGDSLGAALAAALREKLGGAVRFVGIGGPLMAAQGVASPFEIAPLSVLGVFDALRAWPMVRRRAREAGELAARERPQIAVLIDSWGFNLRVAQAIRRAAPGVAIVKYVAPQVWATRPGRARTLAAAVDHLLTIHAFDAPWFERAGLATTFVGNPVLGRDPGGADPAGFRAAIGAALDQAILLLAPGSRRGEVERLLGPFEAAAVRLAADRPGLRVVVLAAEAVADTVRAAVAGWPMPVHLVQGESQRQNAMVAATAALACSGTVTTELALAGAPMVVAYRLGPFTYPIVKLLIRTPYVTLFNVAAGRFVAPELIQGACTGPRLAAAVAPWLDDPARRERQSQEQRAAVERMRGGIRDPSAAAADAVIALLPAQERDSNGV
jgi:lipid-A-disaccharide synthase